MAKPFILVTGATGFIGQRLVHALLKRGETVHALGRDAAKLNALMPLGATPVQADLRDGEAVFEACRGASLVYHVGAFSAPYGKTAEFEAVNIGGTRHVVAGCDHYGVQRLVYVSSPSVVFNGRDQSNLTDDAPYPTRFASVYSRTKKEGEDIVQLVYGHVETVIIRPKAVFGPGDTTLLPRLINAARAGRLPQIGDGKNLVDLTYVDNVVDALLLAGTAPDAVGNTYTITNGEHIELWAIIRQILRTLGLSENLKTVPLPVALAIAGGMEVLSVLTRREPLLTRYSVQILARTQTYDISPAMRDLGYVPRVSVAEGLARTLQPALTPRPSPNAGRGESRLGIGSLRLPLLPELGEGGRGDEGGQ